MPCAIATLSLVLATVAATGDCASRTGFESEPGAGLVATSAFGLWAASIEPDSAGVPADASPAEARTGKPKSRSLWKPLLIMEGVFAAYSCAGYIADGEVLAGANLVGGSIATGNALLAPGTTLSRVSQIALGAGWLGLTLIQANQIDQDAPNREIVLGNFVGLNALVLLGVGIEWVASKRGP